MQKNNELFVFVEFSYFFYSTTAHFVIFVLIPLYHNLEWRFFFKSGDC